MTKLSLNRVHTIEDCALFRETLRQQQASLIIKIGSLQRRIERYREIMEQTTRTLHVKQTVLDACEQLVIQAPPTDLKTRQKRNLAESQVLVLKARLLRYSSVGLLNLENRLQIAENTVEHIEASLQELAAHEVQLAEQTATTSAPQHLETTGQPGLQGSGEASDVSAGVLVKEKEPSISVVLFSGAPFLTLAGGKQYPLPEVKNGVFYTLAPGSSKPGSSASGFSV